MIKTIIISIIILICATWAVANAATVNIGQSAYLFWFTSNQPSKVSVDPNTGKMTRLSVGPAEICAQLKSNMSIKLCETVN